MSILTFKQRFKRSPENYTGEPRTL